MSIFIMFTAAFIGFGSLGAINCDGEFSGNNCDKDITVEYVYPNSNGNK